jgi:hypothetical protein
MKWELLFFAPFGIVLGFALGQLALSVWRFSVWKRRQARLKRGKP